MGFLYAQSINISTDRVMAHLQGKEKTAYVRAMFHRIAPRYDLLNTVISGGMHHRWRRLAAAMAVGPEGKRGSKPGLALDVATGTGDLALALLKQGVPRVVGLDFLPSMLVLADAKARRRGVRERLSLVSGDALHLPFPADAFRVVTSGFNMRNVADLEQALAEMARVTAPGGQVLVLEITPLPPRGLVPRIFRWYFSKVTPVLGRMLAGNREAYAYLPSSVQEFPPPAAFARLLENAGLAEVRHRLLGFGSVGIFAGVKPGRNKD